MIVGIVGPTWLPGSAIHRLLPVPGMIQDSTLVQYDRINRSNIWYWSCIEICMNIVYELVVEVGSTSTVRVPVPVIIPVPVLYE